MIRITTKEKCWWCSRFRVANIISMKVEGVEIYDETYYIKQQQGDIQKIIFFCEGAFY